MTYDELLMEADNNGLIVKEAPLQASDDRIKGRRIAIRQNIPTLRKKADVLAEELGHYYTTVGRIVEQASVSDRKQERIARLWAYDKRIGLAGLVKGYQAHCQNRHELAECLEVSEDFLKEALECYREKYGSHVNFDGYTIIFDPALVVIERF